MGKSGRTLRSLAARAAFGASLPALACQSRVETASPRSPRKLDIVRYETAIAPDFNAHSLRGRTTIVVDWQSDTPTELEFPRHDLAIEPKPWRGSGIAFRLERDALVFTLPPSRTLRRDQIQVSYSGTPRSGLVFGADFVYSDFDTCHWMICREEPGDKASFRLELEVPAHHAVVASGRTLTPPRRSETRATWVWEEERPYSPYLYGFASGPFTRISETVGDTTLQFWGLGESAAALREKFQDTARMLAFLRDRAGLPLPAAVYTQVLVPGSQAQEKSSFALIGKDELDPILSDRTEDWVIVHELAHQWWGNLITCHDWSQFWLNEALVSFMVAAYKEQRWGRDAYERELELFRGRHRLAIEAGFDVPIAYSKPYPSPRIKRAIVYSKGALFLDELRRTLGERAFWAGLKAYTRSHAGGVVETRDLQLALEQASKQDLSRLFRAWVYE